MDTSPPSSGSAQGTTGFGSPQSPMEMKPDPNMLNAGMASTGTSFGSPQPQPHPVARPGSPSSMNYPPLSGSKHFCSICGDRASGKHYGVYSCEGCKGFFKRTVRKELTYACRENRKCVIDKRQRNRCQYCRYMKCLSTGMRREAVQEERHRANEKGNGGGKGEGKGQHGEEGNTGFPRAGNTMPIERIVEAENIALGGGDENNAAMAGVGKGGNNSSSAFVQDLDNKNTKEKMLRQLVEWAKHIPHFQDLKVDDQVRWTVEKSSKIMEYS